MAADSPEAGERLDKAITTRLEFVSRARVQQLIKDGYVLINGIPAKSSYRLESGDTVTITMVASIIAPDAAGSTEPEAIPLDVLYEDADFAAINKPAGMVVHPAAGHENGTLVNALLARWPQVAQVGGAGRAGIVHRLDMDTSGVLLIAKTEPARLALAAQFAARTIQKHYLALVEGAPATPTGLIDVPLGRDPGHPERRAPVATGKPAVSFYRVLRTYRDYSLVEVQPKTGRTHQIRVHLAFLGHPVVGDKVYGRQNASYPFPLERQFLHAESITLTTPGSGQPLTLHAPLPADLQRVLDFLESPGGRAP